MENYKVLTLWNPWAILLAHGIKKNETRPSHTNWTTEKGTYLIHSAQKWQKWQRDLCLTEPFKSELEKLGYMEEFIDLETGETHSIPILPRGYILGSFEVEACMNVIGTDIRDLPILKGNSTPTYLTIHNPELYYGDYNVGRSVWIGKNHQVLEGPFEYKGSQGYYPNYKGDPSLLKFKTIKS